MRLTPTQITALLAAMEQSFDPFDVGRLLLERFGLPIASVTSLLKPFGQQVVDIHSWFHQRNTVEELVAALRDARPRVAEFAKLSDSLGFTELPAQAEFEVLVRKMGSKYADATTFRSDLSRLENAVCRVETSQGYGTGVLVAPNLVLTNHHVVDKVLLLNGGVAPGTHCLFDHKKSAGGYATPVKRCAVTEVRSVSPPAPEDLQPSGVNTDAAKLDYAILVLAEDIGKAPIVAGGEPRGFVQVDAAVPEAQVGDVVIVLQHPLGDPMKIALGSVSALAATRLRHSANTEKGSSGAPVFDRNLRLIAIHHVGIDWPKADTPYNQAVPVALIERHAAANNVRL